jgi:hypothetical protein
MSDEVKERIREGNLAAVETRDFSWMQDEVYKQRQAEKMREVWAKRKAGELPSPNYTSGDRDD